MATKRDERDDFDIESLSSDINKDGSNSVIHASWWFLFTSTSTSHSSGLIAAIVLSIAAGVVAPILAVIFGKIFEAFTSYGASQINGSELVGQVSRYGIGLVVLGCTSGVLNATFLMSWLIFGEVQAKSAREELFDSMLYKDMAWFDSHKCGMETLVSRLQT